MSRRASAFITVLLVLSTTNAGCSMLGKTTSGASSPTPVPTPPHSVVLEGRFASSPGEPFQIAGGCSGVSTTAVPADLANPDPNDTILQELEIDLYAPVLVDDVRAHLLLTLPIDDETEVLDGNGRVVPREEQPKTFSSFGVWTATCTNDGNGTLRVLRIARAESTHERSIAPVFRGLMTRLENGLVEVPGTPSDQYLLKGGHWIDIDKRVVVDGVVAQIASALEIAKTSRVVAHPARQGSLDKLTTWVSNVSDRYDWRVTARERNDHTLVLVELEQI